jgi:single-stranded-DNA-specific exonuclease
MIVAAVKRGDTILVHGDYDVDGQCASAVLVRALRAGGAKVHGFVPHRMRDGYDFGPAGLQAAERVSADLIITCDCGITAVDSVALAKAAGRRVIVTDHHLPGPSLPPADVIINPQQVGDTSGLTMLCGTGVAFKLVQALIVPLGLPANMALHLLDYVALATVADVVPLVGENRTIVKHGLRLLQQTRWPGLRALIKSAGLASGELRAGQVGFVLAPRLNAVGRIADAGDGLRLLLTDNDSEASYLAEQLENLNRERQLLDQAILDQALRTVESQYHDPELCRALVIEGQGWHPGVVGIVASRIVERFGRPAFLIGLDGPTGRGSGRSIEAFDLHAALHSCADLLERFGGHKMAAGLTIRSDKVADFRERFNHFTCGVLPCSALGPEQRVDLELEPHDISDELERLSRHLEPCGMGNPAPVFGLRSVRLAQPRAVGAKHLKATLNTGTATVEAIAFGWAERFADLGTGPLDVAFKLERNEWNGRSILQARLVSLARNDTR